MRAIKLMTKNKSFLSFPSLPCCRRLATATPLTLWSSPCFFIDIPAEHNKISVFFFCNSKFFRKRKKKKESNFSLPVKHDDGKEQRFLLPLVRKCAAII